MDTSTRAMSSYCQHKQAVAQRFSAAATTYDRVAHLQRAVGTDLIGLLPRPIAAAPWVLDLGAGTGYFSKKIKAMYPQSTLVAVDLAQGMLQYAAQQQCADAYLCADMEQIPLRPASVDIIFSSLAVQWSLNFAQTLNECARILRPGGYFLFSSVLEGSLYELKNSWAQVDDAQHVNHFRTASAYTQLCQASPLVIQHLHTQEYVYFYDHLRQLRHELKQLGANHLHAGRRPHLAAKDRLQRLQAAYDTYRRPQGLPATWHIIHLLLRKPS